MTPIFVLKQMVNIKFNLIFLFTFEAMDTWELIANISSVLGVLYFLKDAIHFFKILFIPLNTGIWRNTSVKSL